MNVEEKIARLNYLNSQEWLSDQEHQERERLHNEVISALKNFNNIIGKTVLEEVDKTITKSKKQNKALMIIKRLLFKKPESPATYEEIAQLKLELKKAQLKHDLIVVKLQTPKKYDKVFKILGSFVKLVGPEPTKPQGKKPISHKKLEKNWWKKENWDLKL